MRYRLTIWALLLASLLCFWKAQADDLSLLGVGTGNISASSYVGPGDSAVVPGAVTWASCTWAYTAAKASPTTSLCDLVAVTGGGAVCTLKATTAGSVNLTSSACSGLTPAAACAAASGGSCVISKAYDQTVNGLDWVQTTQANRPAITFGAVSGLPVVTTTKAASSVLQTGNLGAASTGTWTMVFMGSQAATGVVQGFIGEGIGGNFMDIAAAGGGEYDINNFAVSSGVLAPDTNTHAFIGVQNAGDCVFRRDASDNDGGAASCLNRSFATNSQFTIGSDQIGNNCDCTFGEWGIWDNNGANPTFTPTQRNLMITNIKTTRWGF